MRIVMALALAIAAAAGLGASENCLYTGQTEVNGNVRYCGYMCTFSGSVVTTIPAYEVCPSYIVR